MVADLPAGLDAVLLRGLSRSPNDRFATARDLALALEACLGIASTNEVAEWVDSIAHTAIVRRAATVRAIEASPAASAAEPSALAPPAVVASSATNALARPVESTGPGPALVRGGAGALALRGRRRWFTATVMVLGALNLFLVARRLWHRTHSPERELSTTVSLTTTIASGTVPTVGTLTAPSGASPVATASSATRRGAAKTVE